MSSNPQPARRERTAIKPQAVESVAGTTTQAVGVVMIALGVIRVRIRVDSWRRRDRMAGLSRESAVFSWRRAGRAGCIRCILPDAGQVGWLDAVSARRGVRTVSMGGIFFCSLDCTSAAA